MSKPLSPKARTCLINGLVLVFFVVVFFVVRLPYFQTGWGGEDGNGHFAVMFLNHVHGPNRFLMARLGGQDLYQPLGGHPAPMYEMLAYLGSFVQGFVDFGRLDGAGVIFGLKAVAASLQALFFVGLLALFMKAGQSLPPKRRVILLALLFVSAFLPLAINGSNEFQIDSLFGVLMVGAYSLVLAAFALKLWPDRWALPLAGLAAAFLGLGKNEWTLALAAAMLTGCVWLAVAWLRGRGQVATAGRASQSARFGRLLAVSALGLALGNLISLAVDPWHYRSGFSLISGLLRRQSVFSGLGLSPFVSVTVRMAPYLLPLLLMAAYATFQVIRNRRQLEPAVLLGYFFSGALLIGFLPVQWGYQPRLFAPAFAGLLVVCASLFVGYPAVRGWAIKLIAGTAVLVVLVQTAAYLANGEVMAWHSYGTRDLSARLADRSCVHLLRVEEAYRGDFDFVHYFMDLKDARRELSERGLAICPYYRTPSLTDLDEVMPIGEHP